MAYVWALKSLVLLPLDVLGDGLLAETHLRNGDTAWGVLTIIFMLLPFLYQMNPVSLFLHYWYIIKLVITKFKVDFLRRTDLKGVSYQF